VRSRAGQEPYRTALARTWGVDGAEGFYTGFVARPSFARAVREAEGDALNTDDRPVLEFGFAKNLGRFGLFDLVDLQELVKKRGEDRPATVHGAPLDWNRVKELRVARAAYWGAADPDPDPQGERFARSRIAARRASVRGDIAAACTRWMQQPEPPRTHSDLVMIGECMAEAGAARTPEVASWLAREQPIEAHLVLARWHLAQGRPRQAAERLIAAFQAYRTDPWVDRDLVRHTLPLAIQLGHQDRGLALRLYQALEQPFAVRMFDERRLTTRLWLTRSLGAPGLCVQALAPFEPHVRWEESFLTYRYQCYRRQGHPLAGQAREDLEELLAQSPPRLERGLFPSP
jgi:hypothetical protein